MQTPTLGESRFASTHSHTGQRRYSHSRADRIGAEPGLEFELAGPRAKLFFDPKQTRAGIVTCGGLCPGLNNVIRSLFLELHYGYGVAEVLGFRGGYSGLDPERGAEPVKITPQFVDDIHQKGGTILGSSRGPVDIGRAVENLIARGVNILFTVGGDGTQRGAQRSLPGSAQSRPRAGGRRRAEDDRQRRRLRLAHVWIFQRGRGSGARARLRAHRGAERAGRDRARETHGAPRGLHHGRRDRREPGCELRAHSGGAVQARRLSRRAEAADAS